MTTTRQRNVRQLRNAFLSQSGGRGAREEEGSSKRYKKLGIGGGVGFSLLRNVFFLVLSIKTINTSLHDFLTRFFPDG